MKNLFGRVFAIWAITVFVLSLFLALIPILIAGFWSEPKRSHIIHPVYAGWMKIFFTLTGVRRKFTGRQHFKNGENYIVVCNHRSLMDPPLSTVAIPGANKTIAKIEFAKVPVFGIIYRRGSVLVDRRSEESRKASFVKMKEVLNMGLHMCIYPEGTRNTGNAYLQKFHDGAFKLAVDTKKELIPALIINSEKLLPAGKGFYFRPSEVSMHFLPAVSPLNKSVQQLKEEVYQIMENGLKEFKNH